VLFDPYDLSIEVTPQGVHEALDQGMYCDAVMMSFRLNETALIVKSLESVPLQDSKLLCLGIDRLRL